MRVMERFPRGTLPPSAFVALTPGTPKSVAPAPSTFRPTSARAAQTPRGTSDLESMCPTCHTLMQPEHAHYRCATCGYRDSSSF
jgi:hypothetical protein